MLFSLLIDGGLALRVELPHATMDASRAELAPHDAGARDREHAEALLGQQVDLKTPVRSI
jgi:hypothetical protein